MLDIIFSAERITNANLSDYVTLVRMRAYFFSLKSWPAITVQVKYHICLFLLKNSEKRNMISLEFGTSNKKDSMTSVLVFK